MSALIRFLVVSVLIQGGVARAASAPTLFDRGHARVMSVFSASEFYYLNKEDRLSVLGELIKAIDAQYANLEVKKLTIGLDFAAYSKSALETESSFENVVDQDAQAEANLAFFDRMKLFIAGFQDTHFSIHAVHTITPVMLGLDFFRVADKFVVSGKSDKLLAYSKLVSGDEAFTKIAIGDELVEIDAQTPATAIETLVPYVNGSSAGHRRIRATQALSFRSYNLPARGYALVTLKNKDGVRTTFKMPWFFKNATRSDQARYLAKRGFIQDASLQIQWDELKKSWEKSPIDWPGYRMEYSIEGIRDAKLYVDSENAATRVLKTGYIVQDGKAYGMLQIYNFYTEKITVDGKTVVQYMNVIRDFVKELNAAKVPLIIDMRSNPGGYTSYPPSILSLLTEPGKTYPAQTMAYRLTRYMRQLADSWFENPFGPSIVHGGFDFDMVQNLVSESLARGDTHTDAFSFFGDIEADREGGGFSGKIVTLIAPTCVSSCDIMSMLFKYNKRATLVGSHANGTGAGFMSSDDFDTKWKDSYSVVATEIPNFLFGRPGETPGVMFYPGRALEMNSENKPVQPDVSYETTLEDIRDGEQGWLKKAIEVLDRS